MATVRDWERTPPEDLGLGEARLAALTADLAQILGIEYVAV